MRAVNPTFEKTATNLQLFGEWRNIAVQTIVMQKIKSFLKNLGPGLLFASMAIGTSHLVLSTKAGAQYGLFMIVPILLANIFKYPFFEFGVRYTNLTGNSIIEGYRNRGRRYLWLYAIITLATSIATPAALCAVTAGLFMNLFDIENVAIANIAICFFAFNSCILILGKYKLMETLLKFLVPILFVALLVTTALVIQKGVSPPVSTFSAPVLSDQAGILFLITLVGWMPTAVEASSWLSLWTAEKYRIHEERPAFRAALQEFKFGYFITAVLAVCFLWIGYATLYGSGEALSNNAVVFADQVVQLFTSHIGDWAYAFIAVAAFATMYSSCLTSHDAIARVGLEIVDKLLDKPKNKLGTKYYASSVLILAALSIFVIQLLGANMGLIIAIATGVSFLLAPIVGYMNLKNVMSNELPKKFRPKRGLELFTYAGICFLSLFAFYYAYVLLR
jgi:Mn2+/Fe2+ NRAMP family transporter